MKPKLTPEQAEQAGRNAVDSYVDGFRGTPFNRTIFIWRFEDAPAEFQELSSHGGDEDWVVYGSKDAFNAYLPGRLEEVVHGEENSYLYGWGHVCKRELDSGDIVIIFAHA